MSAPGAAIPLLERRAIEAELLLRVFDAASASLGPRQARLIVEQAVDAAALAAGQAFARSAPGGRPSLEHFATVLERWQEGGVLDIRDIRLDKTSLSFCVTRCGYVEKYREMGLPQPLHSLCSCRRDAAFAEGYSPRLGLERPETIAQGHAACRFVFSWRP